MNHSPFLIHEDMIATAAFRLFRSLGPRHLPVVSDRYQVVGMITRATFLLQTIDQKYARLLARIRFNRTTRLGALLPPLAGGLDAVGATINIGAERKYNGPVQDNFE